MIINGELTEAGEMWRDSNQGYRRERHIENISKADVSL